MKRPWRKDGNDGATQKSYKVTSGSYSFRLEVMNHLRDIGNMQATLATYFAHLKPRRLESKRKTIYKWQSDRQRIEEACASGKGSHHRTRAIETGTSFFRLLLKLNLSSGLSDYDQTVYLSLRECCRSRPKRSWSWQHGFLNHHKLAFRCRTRQGQLTPSNAAYDARKFQAIVMDKMAELGVDVVCNADQTAVFFEFLPKKTIDHTGTHTVWVRCAGREKERITCMLLGDSDGTKYTPFLVLKAKVSTVAATQATNLQLRQGFGKQDITTLQQETGLIIHGNPSAWWNAELSKTFLVHFFGTRSESTQPHVLLLLDDFSGHWTPDALRLVASFLEGRVQGVARSTTNMETLIEEQVAAIRRNVVVPKSRAVYQSSPARFLSWVYINHHHLMVPTFAELLTATIEHGARAQVASATTIRVSLKPKCFFDGCYHYEKKMVQRRALNLFRDHRSTMSKPLTDELRAYFRDLKRQVASNTAAGNCISTPGDANACDCRRDMIFSRAFMIMSWNRMSRAANSLAIMHDHMEFVEDALRVYFAQMKNDQLVIKLFAGSRQYNRFSSVFDRALKQAQPELQRRGIQLEDIGSHSIRKGSTSYCSSGSTMCPSSISVHLRARWALDGVQDRYLRYESAGDMFVGRARLACPSISQNLRRFRLDFKIPTTYSFRTRTCFPAAPASITRVVEFTLPFRSLEPNDMPTTNARKRLSDFRFLMDKIEDAANATGSIWMLP
ncbi:TPA: LOW QUALITY PROTEIN: hypothetical protein N0F65_007781 [Lagenidium giganteum]|uniref:DDE-1 domain-containing protein n=1 Tax=Lagenidium giganteum TaxID=4803 RepID=A0AAV2YNB1_9STRA|nr:TPA: LOW QUALITY PROTEIN: hypothetical protein N0F65_007781 [Lagenidium giganteum]